LTICDTECVGHKVISSRSSSSVQRDIRASVTVAPSALYRASRFASRLWRLHLFHSGAHAHARCLPLSRGAVAVVVRVVVVMLSLWSPKPPTGQGGRLLPVR
jgi:hypothetical protein